MVLCIYAKYHRHLLYILSGLHGKSGMKQYFDCILLNMFDRTTSETSIPIILQYKGL